LFGIGMPELLIILVVALLILGPAKLPQVARSLGRGLAEFRRASSELRSTLTAPVEEIRDTLAEDPTKPVTPAPGAGGPTAEPAAETGGDADVKRDE
jgi:TatA/E family protein of Tat protein translocase